jgi:hypothetical protein
MCVSPFNREAGELCAQQNVQLVAVEGDPNPTLLLMCSGQCRITWALLVAIDKTCVIEDRVYS